MIQFTCKYAKLSTIVYFSAQDASHYGNPLKGLSAKTKMPRTRKSLDDIGAPADAGSASKEGSAGTRSESSRIQSANKGLDVAQENAIPKTSKRKLSIDLGKPSPLTIITEMAAQGWLMRVYENHENLLSSLY